MFPKQIFSLQIPESAPVNTTFPLPTAQDRDSVDFGVSYYELEATTQGRKPFTFPTEHAAPLTSSMPSLKLL